MNGTTVSRRTLIQGAGAAAAVSMMPNIKSAKKRVKVIATKPLRNKSYNSALKTAVKKADLAIEAGAADKTEAVRAAIKHPLTLTEKILFAHLYHPEDLRDFKRGADYVELKPDRAGTHDIGGPMAIIQFLASKKERIALPAALVCDHLVQANAGAIPDLKVADKNNYETYTFLRDVSRRL